MILADTSVLSQLTRPDGAARVAWWIDANLAELHIPTFVVSELLFGAWRLRDPVQRDGLMRRTEYLLSRFDGRVLAFDIAAARVHARIAGECQRAGKMLAAVDGRIAAIALVHGAAIATRNTVDFAPAGVALINPWEA